MKKYILCYAVCFIPLWIHAQLYINNQKCIYDKLTNTYLVSIPQEYFNTDYQASITLDTDSLWTSLSIENTPVTHEYLFENVKANKSYLLKGKRKLQDFCSYISFTYLPIIEMKGIFGYDYSNGEFTIYEPDVHTATTSSIKAKWRGGSTNYYDRHKRNYKIKTIDYQGKSKDISFFDMRSDNNWILDAGQIDLFRLRNRIATELWHDMSTKPYYANKEPKALSCVRGKVVEVVLNNEYAGIYSLTEALDRKQMKLKKYNEEKQEFHGQLWKASLWGNSLFWGVEEEYDNSSEQWNAFETKYPDIDDVCPTDYSTLYNAIKFVSTSDDDTFRKEVSEYFDIPVLIDYYIFLELTNAVDNTGKNMYWAVYDKVKDKKLTLAVWDLDATVGSNWSTNPLHPAYVNPDNVLSIMNFYIYNRLIKLNVDDFNEKAEARYKELRQNILSTDRLKERYNSYYNMLKNSGAAQREEIRWSKDSDLNGNELNFDNEIAYINQWLEQRTAYLDSNNSPLITGIKTVTKQSVIQNDGIYNTLGQKLTTMPDKGIYIINGKKYCK